MCALIQIQAITWLIGHC